MQSRPCDALPPVRGTYTYGAPLKDLVWFRAGGAAEVMFRPADSDDLATFLAARPRDMGVLVIGVGSNLLVRDGGIPGVVIRLPAAFGKVSVEGTRIRAGAAALDSALARAAADGGIAGLEFLRGIPGTVGGALKMNAGCRGSEIKDIFVEATAIDGAGTKHVLSAADMGFVYRKSSVPEDFIFVKAVFEGTRDDPAAIRAHGRDDGRARIFPAGEGAHLRLDLQESARPQGLAVDRRSGLPRIEARRGASFGEAL